MFFALLFPSYQETCYTFNYKRRWMCQTVIRPHPQGLWANGKQERQWQPKSRLLLSLKSRRSLFALTKIRQSLTKFFNMLSHYWLSSFKQNSPALLRTAEGRPLITIKPIGVIKMIANAACFGNGSVV